ncbi:MAG TPA: hypothetical protein VHZ02_16440 [Acidimicrobiales bacterium]|nr:hypothetical protein [Acidimicrobiales bacterium]
MSMEFRKGRRGKNGAGPNRTLRHRTLSSAAVIGMAVGGLLVPTVAGAAISTGSKATVVMGGKTYKLSGGACVVTGSHVDIAVGSPTNSLGINAKVQGGKFTNAQIGMVLGGKPVAITTDTGTATSRGGTFKGTDVVSNSTVKGTFSC